MEVLLVSVVNRLGMKAGNLMGMVLVSVVNCLGAKAQYWGRSEHQKVFQNLRSWGL